MDLFDWIDIVSKLKSEGFTLKDIGDKLSWSEDIIKRYSSLLTKVTNILNLCKKYQSGRVTEKVSTGHFNFTERWFRDSGLYDLTNKYQSKLIESFISDKFNWNKSKVQSEASKYKRWQEFIFINIPSKHS
jgi:hypothetical protein